MWEMQVFPTLQQVIGRAELWQQAQDMALDSPCRKRAIKDLRERIEGGMAGEERRGS